VVVLLWVVSLPAAFAVAKVASRVRVPIMILIFGTIMIPTQTILEPLFLVARHLGSVNKIYGVVIVLGSFEVAGSVFLLAAFTKAIPTEVTEAAQVDGASTVRLLMAHIVVARPHRRGGQGGRSRRVRVCGLISGFRKRRLGGGSPGARFAWELQQFRTHVCVTSTSENAWTWDNADGPFDMTIMWSTKRSPRPETIYQDRLDKNTVPGDGRHYECRWADPAPRHRSTST